MTVTRSSKQGLEYIRQFESFEPEVYKDVAGKDTIGFGHLIKPGEVFDTPITREEGERIFKRDVGVAERAVNDLVKVPLNQNQFDALTSFVYNVGRGNFATSTMLAKLNQGDYDGAASEFPRWKYAGGKEYRGLLNRRLAEQATFKTPTV